MKIEAPLYTKEAKKTTKKISLPENIFGSEWNKNLVYQVIVSLTSNQRQKTAHTKDRANVRGGGKKPYRQKGTGQARHGSIRSPLWRGGGVTFGPKNEKDYSKKVNKKMKAKALSVILSEKAKMGSIACVEDLKLETPKTKITSAVLSVIKKDFKHNLKTNTLVVFSSKDSNLEKSWSNLHRSFLTDIDTLNALDVFKHTTVIFVDPEKCIEKLEGRLSEKLKTNSIKKEPKEEKVVKKPVLKVVKKKTVAKKKNKKETV